MSSKFGFLFAKIPNFELISVYIEAKNQILSLLRYNIDDKIAT